MLAREIKAGMLLDGEKLEPERVMAQNLGIAVGTLRKALAVLHEKGMLERVHGSGNYVRQVETDNTIYGFFRLELLSGGGLPSAEVVSVDSGQTDEKVTFATGGSYVRIRRLRYLNKVSAALEEIWLDASLSEKTITEDVLSDSLYEFYKESLGFWIARVEDSLAVANPPDWAPAGFSESLKVKPWSFVERRSWDQLNRQVEFSRTWYDPHTTRYVARWT